LILPSRLTALRRQVDAAITAKKVKPNVVVEIDSYASALKLVADNIGYAIWTRRSVRDEVERGDLQTSKIVDPKITRSLIAVTPRSRPPMRGLSEIIKVIKTELNRPVPHSDKSPGKRAPSR